MQFIANLKNQVNNTNNTTPHKGGITMQTQQNESNKRHLEKQHGGIVITVILVITVLAVIGLLAFKTYGYAMEKQRAGQALTLMEEIGQGVGELYTGHHNFATLTTQTVIDAGIVTPADVDGANIISPWYNTNHASLITVGPGAAPTSFTVTIAAIPTAACTKIGGSFLSMNTVTVSANGVAVANPADLATNCATADPATVVVNF